MLHSSDTILGRVFSIVAQMADWYEIGNEHFQVRAEVTGELDRERLFARMDEQVPGFAEYQRQTKRKIPVFTLERID